MAESGINSALPLSIHNKSPDNSSQPNTVTESSCNGGSTQPASAAESNTIRNLNENGAAAPDVPAQPVPRTPNRSNHLKTLEGQSPHPTDLKHIQLDGR